MAQSTVIDMNHISPSLLCRIQEERKCASLPDKKKVLVFSDFGIDDIVAVLYAYYSDTIEIVGIVSDYGNVSREAALKNVKYLQSLTGITDIPVIGGAVSALTGTQPQFYPEVHGVAGLGPIIPDEIDFDPSDISENFYEIKEIINQYAGEIYIYSAGRLSSLATAFVLYPETMKKVKEFYVMGGAFLVPGNVTPVAEANFYGDPYAANILLQLSPKKIHLIPLDVTMFAIITPAMIDRLHDFYVKSNDKVGQIIKPMVDYYYEFYKKTYPDISGSPLHDLLAMWALADGDKMVFEEVPIRVAVNTGCTFGESIGDFRKSPDKAPWPVHKIAKQFHYGQFISEVFTTLQSGPSR
ncbi:nucleoside hydrolase [Rossellomorea sp. YZS02]|uniref:nucleoside hydrolase n=1 Tax=Rossellomorea sp. YZS02 TaxID=3097358 RepID=UPI002A11D351|nr:nucleoside hydrolase [Rossellomorea sp. YZS02]MDX8343820.1 nucleoside hydrolase [Rossellomorea sp. YZS02]